MHGLEMHLMFSCNEFCIYIFIFFYIEAIKYVYCLFYQIYIVSLLSAQPLLSGQIVVHR